MKSLLRSLLLAFVAVNLHAAEKLTAVGFESVTVTAGSYVNFTNGPVSWNLTTSGTTYENQYDIRHAITSGSWDIVSGSHPMAPLGTDPAGKFLDPIGTNGATCIRHNLTGLDTNSIYTLTFKAAAPTNLTAGTVGAVVIGIRSSLTFVRNDTKDWLLQFRPRCDWFDLVYLTNTVTGTAPTNSVTSTTVYGPESYYATNHWRTNIATFQPTTTTCVLEILGIGGPEAHAGIFLDDISVTGP